MDWADKIVAGLRTFKYRCLSPDKLMAQSLRVAVAEQKEKDAKIADYPAGEKYSYSIAKAIREQDDGEV